MKLITTLNEIKKYGPCEPSWNKMVKHFGDLDKPIHLRDIIESNGVEDAIWCMRVWPEYSREWRMFAVWCAMQTDDGKNAIDVAERFANGEATVEEFRAAARASIAAARAAARDSAWAAAWAAASDAARDAARDAQKRELLRVIAKIEGDGL